MSKSALESLMMLQLRADKIIGWTTEYEFAKPDRKWRSDFAWKQEKLLLEIDGGTWNNGRHTRGSGYAKDCEKLAEATLRGWRVIRVTADQVKSGEALGWIKRALKE